MTEKQGGETFAFRRRPKPKPNQSRGKGGKGAYPPRKPQTPKRRRLNLRRMEEFKYELGEIMSDVPPNQVGTLKGSIIAKADKIDIKAAEDFIIEKEKEGMIPPETAKHLFKLLKYYSIYR